MTWNNKVIWSEGMLLLPQHLQQHDRYLQTQLESRVSALRPYSYGFSSLRIDEQQLAQGKLALLACAGVLPDGTPFCLPQEDQLPLPLTLPDGARNLTIMLALPLRRPRIPESTQVAGTSNFTRYGVTDFEAFDSTGLDSSAVLQVGSLRLVLAPESEVLHAWTSLGVAHVIERRADNRLLLDTDYCPPSLDYRVAPRLASMVDELVGLLHQRGEALASRVGQPGTAGVAEIVDFLFLQMVNREEALFAHLASMTGLHPESLFRVMVQLAGEVAIFGRSSKRPSTYPTYQHDKLRECFLPVLDEIRKSLSVVMDAQAIPIPLEERQFGLRVAVIPDPDLIRSASFVLAVNAEMPPDAVRNGFPPKVKIGAIEKIRDLVNLQLPGVALRPLPVAPRQLPFHAGYTYFELDKNSEYWKPLLNSAGFAMHVAGEFPGLSMEFWAIRQ